MVAESRPQGTTEVRHFLLLLSLLVTTQSIIVSGYLNSINTTLEKRYKLTSREIGIIYMCYEFSCIPTTIILSIIGRKLNRPQLLGISGLIMAAGMFLFSVPHFVGSSYELIMCNENNTKILCFNNNTYINKRCPEKNTDTYALCIFCFSQLLIGIGASPIYILGPTYLWDNLSTKTYSIYSSIFYTCSGLGPPIGFVLGGIFLGIYIDVPKYSKCENMNNRHPLWLGAWWIGLVVVSCLTILFVVPLLLFPKDIPFKKERVEVQIMDVNTTAILDIVSGDEIKKIETLDIVHIPSTGPLLQTKFNLITFISDSFLELTKLFTNSVWLLISLTTVMENTVVQACTTFISKYLQIIFNVPANHASYIVGILVVLGAILGVAFGGLIMNKLQPNISTSIKIMIVIISSSGIMVFTLIFLGCNDLKVVGVSVGYSNLTVNTNYTLLSECNSQCHCFMETYEPICDMKRSRNFYSACHAGCRSISNISNHNFVYTNCTCTDTDSLHVGKCSPKCPTYYLTLIVIFVTVFLTASGQIPINIITLSSVAGKDSSMALGVQVFMVRVFAFIPVPLYFGAIFDSVCLLRIKDKCNNGSICREYNLSLLPYVWLGTIMCVKLLSFGFIFLTYVSSRKNRIIDLGSGIAEIQNNNSNKDNISEKIILKKENSFQNFCQMYNLFRFMENKTH